MPSISCMKSIDCALHFLSQVLKGHVGPPGPTAHPSLQTSWSKFLPRKAIGVMVCLPGHIVHIHHILGVNTCQHSQEPPAGRKIAGRAAGPKIFQSKPASSSFTSEGAAIFGHGLPPLQHLMRSIWGDWSASYYVLLIKIDPQGPVCVLCQPCPSDPPPTCQPLAAILWRGSSWHLHLRTRYDLERHLSSPNCPYIHS